MANTELKIFEKTPLTFSVTLTKNDDRLDCAWFNPIVKNKINELQKKKRGTRKLVTLSEIADVKGGKRLPKGTVFLESEANTIPYIRVIDVKNLKVNVNTANKISKEIHQKIHRYQLQKGDIVITIVGTIGEVGIFEDRVEVCNFTENIAKVRLCEDSVLTKFILYSLDSDLGRMQTERFSVGSLQYKLSLNSCRNIKVCIPYKENKYDIDAQKKIVDEVDNLFKKVNKKKGDRESLIKQVNTVVVKKLKIPIPNESNESYFIHNIANEPTSRLDVLFNSPILKNLISNLKQHSYEKLGKLIKLQGNQNISPSDFYRLIELEHIDEKTGRITTPKEVLELGSQKILLKQNNILVTKLQPESGKIVIVPHEYDGAVGSSEFFSLALDSVDISLKYLWAILRSDYVLKQWKYKVSGSSRMRIGLEELEDTIIPIPDKNMQDEIVKDIEEKIKKIDEISYDIDELFKKTKKKFINSVGFS